MAAQIFKVDIQGYWRDINKSTLPIISGVFFVYEAAYNPKLDSILLRKLIYIGESENIKESIVHHCKYNDWLNHVRYGNELCYALAYVNPTERTRVKEAFVRNHKPIENKEIKISFHYDSTTIKTSGDAALLSNEFSVSKL